ncbi:MAG TPA: phosphoribosylglycinamide formyltransferase [Bacteroidia bacterium]|jgi:phosphoribosylglycinamide formyltransferase-1|nr:phosphoribosylglycinamide formyltransferase [Bacteroidia bacterium]
MKKISVFASGQGTNTLNIIRYFRERGGAEVALIVVNNPEAGIIKEAQKLGIPVTVYGKDAFYNSQILLQKLADAGTDLIVLAGFLWLLPKYLTDAYPNRIINIHPALLPKFGGKGMYGMHVHEAVVKAGETESGITIHRVNERYDEGAVLFQAKCALDPGETPESLALKIRHLEHLHFPRLIESLLKD